MEGSNPGQASTPRDRSALEYEVWEELDLVALAVERSYTAGATASTEQAAKAQALREQTVKELEAAADVLGAGASRIAVLRGKITAQDRGDATWAFVDQNSDIKERAEQAGRDGVAESGDGPAAKGPRLAAVPPQGARGGLTFEEHALEPVQETRRVKR